MTEKNLPPLDTFVLGPFAQAERQAARRKSPEHKEAIRRFALANLDLSDEAFDEAVMKFLDSLEVSANRGTD